MTVVQLIVLIWQCEETCLVATPKSLSGTCARRSVDCPLSITSGMLGSAEVRIQADVSENWVAVS